MPGFQLAASIIDEDENESDSYSEEVPDPADGNFSRLRKSSSFYLKSPGRMNDDDAIEYSLDKSD